VIETGATTDAKHARAAAAASRWGGASAKCAMCTQTVTSASQTCGVHVEVEVCADDALAPAHEGVFGKAEAGRRNRAGGRARGRRRGVMAASRIEKAGGDGTGR
jgi:hypothetical protein